MTMKKVLPKSSSTENCDGLLCIRFWLLALNGIFPSYLFINLCFCKCDKPEGEFGINYKFESYLNLLHGLLYTVIAIFSNFLATFTIWFHEIGIHAVIYYIRHIELICHRAGVQHKLILLLLLMKIKEFRHVRMDMAHFIVIHSLLLCKLLLLIIEHHSIDFILCENVINIVIILRVKNRKKIKINKYDAI